MDNMEEKLNMYEKEIDNLIKQKEDLNSQINDIDKEIDRLIEKITELKNNEINKYESVFLLRTDINIEDLENSIREIKSNISNNRIELEERIGVKKLAYDTKGQQKAYYLRIEWNLSKKDVAEIELKAREDDNILKFITIKCDK